ncbi:hypothetical protein [Streptomyces thermoviolaceus]|uniref:hypothetical protein n=1 Tax=Streptomyces thermoviolaceus TaxID=1952 RepID=UPI00167C04C6|nr:hypothetical protein [Streptomyces thermoviolaceus]GGV76772.1 hypothetical protein GCM10010499_35090 [Streptomyces thermoviolaceus subsp. apingens]
MHRHGQDQILGTAYSDHVLVEFLEDADVADPEAVLDDPRWALHDPQPGEPRPAGPAGRFAVRRRCRRT